MLGVYACNLIHLGRKWEGTRSHGVPLAQQKYCGKRKTYQTPSFFFTPRINFSSAMFLISPKQFHKFSVLLRVNQLVFLKSSRGILILFVGHFFTIICFLFWQETNKYCKG